MKNKEKMNHKLPSINAKIVASGMPGRIIKTRAMVYKIKLLVFLFF